MSQRCTKTEGACSRAKGRLVLRAVPSALLFTNMLRFSREQRQGHFSLESLSMVEEWDREEGGWDGKKETSVIKVNQLKLKVNK